MSTFVSYRNGGKTDEEGLFKWFSRLFTTGNPTNHSTTSMQVVQRGAGANMSVDISIGDASMPDTAGSGYNLYGWNDAAVNQSVAAADPTNPRIDVVYCYVDLSVVQSVTVNNPNALKFGVFAGTPAGSPVAPTNAAIQSFLGATTPFIKLAQVAVAANASTIVNANITDFRNPIAMKGRLWGGALNTIGHIVPNVVDDTVALLNAVQTFANKTFTGAAFPSPVITLWDAWQAQSVAPNTVIYNGNRQYTLTYTGVDLTGVLSNGYRTKFTRTVAAPSKCASLNGSSQYFNNTAAAGMTFTDDFTVSAWIKLSAYPVSEAEIVSRYNGTSGWELKVTSDGRLHLTGRNGGSGNFSEVISYQALPLNKWVHIATQLDMSGFTVSPTNSYIMFDGVDVPALVTRAGTNPTALVQAGNLEIGSENGGTNFFPGKIAQVAIFNAKVTEATMQGYISQGLAGTETALVSGYSLSNSLTDLNVTNANNLTAQGAATTTTTDSPFAQGAAAGLIEHGIQTSISFSTNTTQTVQVPEGSAIPTSGGVSAAAYSQAEVPFGFPADKDKMTICLIHGAGSSIVSGTPVQFPGGQLQTMIGPWHLNLQFAYQHNAADARVFLSTNATAPTSNGARLFSAASGTHLDTVTLQDDVVVATPTPYLIGGMAASGTISMRGLGDDPNAFTVLKALCGYR